MERLPEPRTGDWESGINAVYSRNVGIQLPELLDMIRCRVKMCMYAGGPGRRRRERKEMRRREYLYLGTQTTLAPGDCRNEKDNAVPSQDNEMRGWWMRFTRCTIRKRRVK